MTHDRNAREVPPYPIALRLAGRRCAIVGGGAVAERKARGLLDAGAVVTIIAPELAPGLHGLASVGTIEVWPRPYAPGDLRAAGAFLAIAATDRREVNAAVGAEARALGIPVNVVDALREGDFSVPATLRRGRLTVAVSTAGGSPVVAGLVRDRLAAALSDGYVALLELVAALRQEGLARGRRHAPDTWRAALTPEIVALAEAGRLDEAERRVREALETINCQGRHGDATGAGGRESLRAEVR
jgi:precorrin-2 dehydrogenase/sirohydrochlorin ferrochelatase